jgi:prepilin signal peptidase PulO-like enzyme (type II secretory pathway)
VRVEGLGEREREHLEVFAQSHKYLPFGPYLALGGAVVVLYGSWVDWAITDAYPRWARSLFS